MSAKEILHGDAAKKAMIDGVNKLANAVIVTLGPKGWNVAIEQSFGSPKVTKDGVTVAKAITLEDKVENIGAQMVREVASKTNDNSGDGTTTATVLTQAIVNEGYKYVTAGMNPMDIKRGIDMATEAVIAELKSSAKKISSSEEIAQVATISANSDKDIGQKIAHGIEKVGHKSPITVEEGKGTEFEVEVVEGMNFDRGYLSPYFATNSEKMTCELENPYILIFDKKISNLQQILSVVEKVAQSGRPLLIIAEDVEGEALAMLVVNKIRGGLKVCAVKAPGFGDRRKAMLEDIAILTGGQVVSEELGAKIESAEISTLGTAKRVVVDKDSTTIVDGNGVAADIKARCGQIESQMADTTSDYDREKLQERLAKLSGGVAILRVGGSTEVEVKEKKDRVEDALHATKAALEEGIVAGGGVALLYASKVLAGLKGQNEDQDAGIKIIKQALQSPVRKISANAGFEGSVVVEKLLEQSSKTFGFNAQSGEYVDMIKAGIIDPVKIVRTALQNASSIASLFLTTDAVVYEPKKAESSAPAMPGGMGGMGGMY